MHPCQEAGGLLHQKQRFTPSWNTIFAVFQQLDLLDYNKSHLHSTVQLLLDSRSCIHLDSTSVYRSHPLPLIKLEHLTCGLCMWKSLWVYLHGLKRSFLIRTGKENEVDLY